MLSNKISPQHLGQSKYKGYTFGLDIGIASVGWAVLSNERIIDLGVRAFDKAETAKEGDSLNLIRRNARLMRQRLHHRTWRLTKLSKLLKREGLIGDARIFKNQQPYYSSIWQLRVEGLDRCLLPEEWARVIYHICKHRGFHWVSRAEEKKASDDSAGEGGKVKSGLANTQRLMSEKGYRTAAEMVLVEFPDAQRNKYGEYTKALSRILLGEELKLLFNAQRSLGNLLAGRDLEHLILGSGDQKEGLFWQQRPALFGIDLLKMLGKCTFEKTEYRAPKACFTAERHVWLTRLNNLRVVVDGITRPLNESERQIALPIPYQQAGDFTYKQLRSALVKSGWLPEGFRYTGLSYPSDKQKIDGNAKDPETSTLIKFPAWQELRKTLTNAGLLTEWQSISGMAHGGEPTLLDQITCVLTVYKDDIEVIKELEKLALPNSVKMIEALSYIRFDKFSNLSLRALRRIVPLMEHGYRYDEAVAQIEDYGHHSQLFVAGAGAHLYLPPFYSGRDRDGRMLFVDDMNVPRNPVVLRALNQARKVVNALISKHGSPHAIHIEMARDLSKPLDERRKIKKEQDNYRDSNEADKTSFTELFGSLPSGQEFQKWRLYREQLGKCAYSLEPIILEQLLEAGYVEIDHVLPSSRSFDDSLNNKVLVLAKENRDKGNRTPFEYMTTENSDKWHKFVAFVESNKSYRLAKRTRLLRKDFGIEEATNFRERNLNDTRYICRFFKNFVEQHLQFAEGKESRRCVVVTGQLTSLLRARWGLIKVRDQSDRHHALDALVIAACSNGMIKRMSDYARRKELQKVRAGFVDIETGEVIDPMMFIKLETHFPEPWPNFRNEVVARLTLDDIEKLKAEIQLLGTYSSEALLNLKPLFVSRAPQRRNGGAAHKDTIYGQPDQMKQASSVTQKVNLSSLSIKDLGKLIEPHRNERLYAEIRRRLEAFDGKGEKAFTPNNPFYKPDRNGNLTGPLVRSVTMVIDKITGIEVRGGIARNDTMLRVDIFTKANKFHLVPIYVNHRVKGLPNRAIVAAKDESEWTLIDDSFGFCFSLYPNDLVRVHQVGKAAILGYYSSCHRGTGAINIWSHDRNILIGKAGIIEGIGIKTALKLEKFNVDVLGNIYPCEPECRRDLA